MRRRSRRFQPRPPLPPAGKMLFTVRSIDGGLDLQEVPVEIVEEAYREKMSYFDDLPADVREHVRNYGKI